MDRLERAIGMDMIRTAIDALDEPHWIDDDYPPDVREWVRLAHHRTLLDMQRLIGEHIDALTVGEWGGGGDE